MAKILLNAGYLFPQDINTFVYDIDIFKSCGIVNILPMAFSWPEDQNKMKFYYDACLSKGLKPWVEPKDIAFTHDGVAAWADKVISDCPEIIAMFPKAEGWVGATDIIVTTSNTHPTYPTTNDTYLAKINAVFNALIKAKALPITFETFDGMGDVSQYKSLLKQFLLRMDARSYLIPNVFVNSANCQALITAHVEACLEAGAGYGAMMWQPAPYKNLPLLIDELNSLVGKEGAIRTYSDNIGTFHPMITEYANYVIGNVPDSISPTSTKVVQAGVKEGTVKVMAVSTWVASTNSGSWDWIAITAGWNGTGNGEVKYLVLPNSTGKERVGYLTIAGQIFTITQAGDEVGGDIRPKSQCFFGESGTGAVTVTVDCDCSWIARTNSGSWGWIAITTGWGGKGSGMVTYLVTENNSGKTRTGTLEIAGRTFTITQVAQRCSGII
jgi:hypothetical protein